jgi:ribosomal protein S18 acetylase RimI-like enzyme
MVIMAQKTHPRLDKSVWDALHGPHSQYSNQTPLACGYKTGYYDFCAIKEHSEKAYHELSTIVEPQRAIFVWGTGEEVEYKSWKHLASFKVVGMVLDSSQNLPDYNCVPLFEDDVSDMIELTKITDMEGEFNENNLLLGDFFGVKEEGKLVAMAGERIQTTEYIELANVCTHPDYRKRGYGGGLSSHMCNHIFVKGRLPYLHVFEENIGAIRLYEKLGFKHVFTKYMDVLLRT